MRMKTSFWTALFLLAVVSCGQIDSRLQKALSSMDVDYVADQIEHGLKVDGLKFQNGKTVLQEFASRGMTQIVIKGFSNGTRLVPEESGVLTALLENQENVDLGSVLKIVSHSDVLEKQLDFLKQSGFSRDNLSVKLADYVFAVGGPDDVAAYIRDFGKNERFLRQAAVKNDLQQLSDLIKELGLDANGLTAIADSGNIGAVRYALAQKPGLDYDQVLRQSVDTLTRDTLISMYPLVSDQFDYKAFTNSLLSSGNYDAASYMINYGATLANLSQDDMTQVVEYFQNKEYTGDKAIYTDDDLAGLDSLKSSLEALGISPYLVLRNEIFSRHGYISVNPVLARLNNKLSWYKPLGNVTVKDLAPVEQKNVLYLRSKEEAFDNTVVVQWLNDKPYVADEHYFIAEEDYQLPSQVKSSLSNLGINASFLLRSEIYARRQYAGLEPKVKKLFQQTVWYKPASADLPDFPKGGDTDQNPGYEYANIQLLQSREWIEVLDAEKQHQPDGIRAIPVLGLNTVYLKEITPDGSGNGSFFVSAPTQGLALDASAKLLDGLDLGVPEGGYGISDDLAQKIQDTEDPIEALSLFFENKKYQGLVDSYVYTEADLTEVPAYLTSALDQLGLSWPFVLRTEIHARHGAQFDPETPMGKVFSKMSWYKPLYRLVPNTLSRLPLNKGGNRIEVLNFALMEGFDLHHALLEAGPNASVVFDVAGHSYYIKMGSVDADFVKHHLMNEDLKVDPFFSARAFSTLNKSQNASIQDFFNEMLNASLPPVPEAYYDEGRCGG
jgi:hypothetical protein